MKPVRVTHWRCSEPLWGEETWAWAPDDWDEDQISDAAFNAQKKYLADLDTWHEAGGKDAPNKAGMYSQPDFRAHPDKTVAEVIAIHEEEKRVYREWEETRRKAARPFATYLREEGFILAGDEDFGEVQIELDWGHRHGQNIDYGPMLNPKDVRNLEARESLRSGRYTKLS